ncbi:MAG TPA: winged helix DNA-binding protein [Sphingomicrobium sp.]|jgi:DNA-binding MarR family transcriptional regulator|nr:winged helix DNA-binding protein [Sphingomicrobium sp.]
MSELEHPRPASAVDYQLAKPALLFASSPRRRASAEPALTAGGVRLVGSLHPGEAGARLDEQLSLGLAWLELGEEDATPELDRLLARLNDMADMRGTLVVAAVPLALVDMVAARLTARTAEILVDPDEAQRAAALAVAISGVAEERGVADVGKDNAARLRQLSDEMGRIASTLARLSSGPGAPAIKPGAGAGQAPDVDAEAVRAIIRARRLRSRYFSEELFADPAWDMLLDLLQAEIAQLRVPVSSLCIAAAVPATTALRWIKTMTEQGLFVRRADPHDGRRVFVELAPAASDAMRRYFAEVGSPAVV